MVYTEKKIKKNSGSKLEGSGLGFLLGGFESIGVGVIDGLWQSGKELVYHGINGLYDIPTTWMIEPRTFALITLGSTLGGFLAGDLKKKKAEIPESKLAGMEFAPEKAINYGTWAAVLTATGEYTLQYLDTINANLPEILRGIHPSLGDIIAVSVPAMITAGLVSGYNKQIEKYLAENDEKTETKPE